MSGGIGYESVVVAGVLLLCLGAVAVLGGDLVRGRRRWFVLAVALGYWGLARAYLELYGRRGPFVPILVAPVLLTVGLIAFHRFRDRSPGGPA